MCMEGVGERTTEMGNELDSCTFPRFPKPTPCPLLRCTTCQWHRTSDSGAVRGGEARGSNAQGSRGGSRQVKHEDITAWGGIGAG